MSQLPPRPPEAWAAAPPSVSRAFELAVAVLRRRWGTSLMLSLLLVGPGALLTAAFAQRFNEVAADLLPRAQDGLAGEAFLTTADAERLIGALVAYVAASTLAGLLGSIASVAFAHLAAADRQGLPNDLGAPLRVGLRRTPSLLAFSLVSSAVVVAITLAGLGAALLSIAALSGGNVQSGGLGAFLALVAGVAAVGAVAYLSLRWAFAYPLMAVDDIGWRASMAGSWRLSGGHLWRVLAVVVLGAIVTLLLSAFVAQLAGILLVDLVAVPLGLDRSVAESLVVALATVLLAPLAPLLVAELFLDVRSRPGGAGPAG